MQILQRISINSIHFKLDPRALKLYTGDCEQTYFIILTPKQLRHSLLGQGDYIDGSFCQKDERDDAEGKYKVNLKHSLKN